MTPNEREYLEGWAWQARALQDLGSVRGSITLCIRWYGRDGGFYDATLPFGAGYMDGALAAVGLAP